MESGEMRELTPEEAAAWEKISPLVPALTLKKTTAAQLEAELQAIERELDAMSDGDPRAPETVARLAIKADEWSSAVFRELGSMADSL
jgi:hypothetical protein